MIRQLLMWREQELSDSYSMTTRTQRRLNLAINSALPLFYCVTSQGELYLDSRLLVVGFLISLHSLVRCVDTRSSRCVAARNRRLFNCTFSCNSCNLLSNSMSPAEKQFQHCMYSTCFLRDNCELLRWDAALRQLRRFDLVSGQRTSCTEPTCTTSQIQDFPLAVSFSNILRKYTVVLYGVFVF